MTEPTYDELLERAAPYLTPPGELGDAPEPIAADAYGHAVLSPYPIVREAAAPYLAGIPDLPAPPSEVEDT